MGRTRRSRHAAPVAACLLVALSGCDNGGGQDAPPARSGSRVNAVAAKPAAETAPAPEAFCDVYKPSDQAPDFHYPALDGPAPQAAPDGWRWVNVWATWCKPCIEEMPRLAEWEAEMDAVGELVLLSVDESAELVSEFRAAHPDIPESLRATNPSVLGPWLTELGAGGAASLPVHLFVDPAGKLRCVRAGGVSESDRAAVERLVSEG